MDNSSFVHTPLENAATQIRLLRFLTKGSDGCMMFGMNGYDLFEQTLDANNDPDSAHREATPPIQQYRTHGVVRKRRTLFASMGSFCLSEATATMR
jgi:hypothetical protein